MDGLFLYPVQLPSQYALWLLIPLCAGVALVYKAVRTNDVRRLWIDVALLLGYMIAGLTALAVVLYLIQEYWP